MVKVKINELIEAIEFNSDLGESFINLTSGEICFISFEEISLAENDGRHHPEWQNELIEIAKHYLENPDNYLALPSQRDANEYRMMEDFASSLEDEKTANQLLITLRGQGAFRRFKDSVILLGLDNEWYKFRDDRYKKFILEWCEDNGISCEIKVIMNV